MAKKIITKLKRQKKKWLSILAPKLYNENHLGESFVHDESELMGKRIKVSLMNLVNNMRKQNVHLLFEVNKVSNATGQTKIIGYSMSNSLIKRAVRSGKTRIDDSTNYKSKNGFLIRIKPFILTNNRAPKGVAQNLRRKIKELLKDSLKQMTHEQFFNALVKGDFQKNLRSKLTKIFPLRTFEIRLAKIEKSGTEEVIEEKIDTKELQENSESQNSKSLDIKELQNNSESIEESVEVEQPIKEEEK
jgi:small subunit ribosomal protein S3Ae